MQMNWLQLQLLGENQHYYTGTPSGCERTRSFCAHKGPQKGSYYQEDCSPSIENGLLHINQDLGQAVQLPLRLKWILQHRVSSVSTLALQHRVL